MVNKSWLSKTFKSKRIFTSVRFSAIVAVTYWAATIYEKAFTMNWWWGVLAFILVVLVLLLFGGSLLDSMSK
ncbi:MAG: hypothetical protein ABIJ14_02190 [Nanoarchaeota archaeon]|nr:hypothetical protein [Nanoarchaeota archaeon]